MSMPGVPTRSGAGASLRAMPGRLVISQDVTKSRTAMKVRYASKIAAMPNPASTTFLRILVEEVFFTVLDFAACAIFCFTRLSGELNRKRRHYITV